MGEETDQDSLPELQRWTTGWIVKKLVKTVPTRDALGTKEGRMKRREGWEEGRDRKDNSRSHYFK